MPAVKGKQQRTKDQVAQDKALISELSLKGCTQQRIAEIINERYRQAGSKITITAASVNIDIRKIREEWERSGLLNVHEHKLLQLKKIDALESEYWRSWQKSIEKPTKRTLSKKISYRSGQEIKQTESREEDFYGDPRFLDGINKCIQQRCSILGLTKEEKTTVDGGMIITIEESTVGLIENK